MRQPASSFLSLQILFDGDEFLCPRGIEAFLPECAWCVVASCLVEKKNNR